MIGLTRLRIKPVVTAPEADAFTTQPSEVFESSSKSNPSRINHNSTWSWPSGWCIGLRSWLRGFDAQLGHLYDACTSLPQKSQAAIKWLEIRKKKKRINHNNYSNLILLLAAYLNNIAFVVLKRYSQQKSCTKVHKFFYFVLVADFLVVGNKGKLPVSGNIYIYRHSFRTF